MISALLETRTQVPNGAAIKVVKPNGRTNDLSEKRTAWGSNCTIAGSPVRLAMATATIGSFIILRTITIINEAPKPTKPRMKPAKSIVPATVAITK